jgi:hypothetical protein
MREQHSPEPAEGEQRAFAFTADNGSSTIVTATYERCWSDEIEPCIPLELVAMILDTWTEADPEHRKYGWPPTDRSDDDCAITYLSPRGELVLDWWRTANWAEHYSLNALQFLLRVDHFTLAPVRG